MVESTSFSNSSRSPVSSVVSSHPVSRTFPRLIASILSSLSCLLPLRELPFWDLSSRYIHHSVLFSSGHLVEGKTGQSNTFILSFPGEAKVRARYTHYLASRSFASTASGQEIDVDIRILSPFTFAFDQDYMHHSLLFVDDDN